MRCRNKRNRCRNGRRSRLLLGRRRRCRVTTNPQLLLGRCSGDRRRRLFLRHQRIRRRLPNYHFGRMDRQRRLWRLEGMRQRPLDLIAQVVPGLRQRTVGRRHKSGSGYLNLALLPLKTHCRTTARVVKIKKHASDIGRPATAKGSPCRRLLPRHLDVNRLVLCKLQFHP